ncbi:DUF4399 domain-containing protein [Prosthecomicrobium hirschii]|uniref:DUF4399 domain-containing protein n=1 Tax=Prosthecodimorpha hirschii TaxID=665126 RepID=UPI00222067BE|nr:DUF4399 domain-containing protein [Prosthecomicrobium hirschii]MCW1843365.1 DUF4399 domain-containing protein [Prosthecomicrobium hirschii]
MRRRGLREAAAGIALAVGIGLPAGVGLRADRAVAAEGSTPAPKGAAVYFQTPQDGQRVPRRFTVRIGLRDMGVAPAGVATAGTGHHHVLIDAEAPPAGEPIPADFNHIHLGNGQTEVELTLTPGRHTLQLVVGDHRHMPHQPPVQSPKITVTVY